MFEYSDMKQSILIMIIADLKHVKAVKNRDIYGTIIVGVLCTLLIIATFTCQIFKIGDQKLVILGLQ